MLTVPVHAKSSSRIVDVAVDNTQHWQRRHLRAIDQNYSAAPHFNSIMDQLREYYAKPYPSLAELNTEMLQFWLVQLGITTPTVRASELNVDGEATDRLINLVRAVGGDSYYSGAYALDVYLDAGKLEQAGIGLMLQRWQAPKYNQLHDEFLPDLSIVDLLMNTGSDALRVIRQGGGRSE